MSVVNAVAWLALWVVLITKDMPAASMLPLVMALANIFHEAKEKRT